MSARSGGGQRPITLADNAPTATHFRYVTENDSLPFGIEQTDRIAGSCGRIGLDGLTGGKLNSAAGLTAAEFSSAE